MVCNYCWFIIEFRLNSSAFDNRDYLLPFWHPLPGGGCKKDTPARAWMLIFGIASYCHKLMVEEKNHSSATSLSS